MSSTPQHVPSPCMKVCAIDPDTQLCRGCHRTLDEIADWVEYTPEEKLAVLARVEARKAAARVTR